MLCRPFGAKHHTREQTIGVGGDVGKSEVAFSFLGSPAADGDQPA
jgi:hypothetical protein